MKLRGERSAVPKGMGTSTPERHHTIGAFTNTDETLSTILESSFSENELENEDELYIDISIAENKYDEILKQRPRRVGSIWNALKPIKNDSLFAKVVNSPEKILDILQNLIDKFHADPVDFTMELLEFVAHVAGFQKLEFTNFYDYDNHNFNTCITELENEVNKVFQNSFCLMDNDSLTARYMKYAIYDFIHKLILNAHCEGILYEDAFTKHFFPFLRHLSVGNLRPTRMTGVVLGLKVLSSITHCYASIKGDREYEMLFGEHLKEIMGYLYQLFRVNRHLYPVKDHIFYMREIAASELMIWLVNAPDFFFVEKQAFSNYRKFVKDPEIKVRLVTLKILERMLRFNKLENYIRDTLESVALAIEEMFEDTNTDVQIAALRCYSVILLKFNDIANTNKLIYLTFCEKYELANEAAKVLANFWAMFSSRYANYRIKKIAEIANLQKYSIYAVNLVEIFFNHIKELTDWSMMLDLIEMQERNIQLKTAIVKIFLKSAKFVLTDGKAKLNRKYEPRIIQAFVKENLIAFLVKNFLRIAKLMQDFLSEVLNLLVYIDDKHFKRIPANELKLLLKYVQEIFSNEKEKQYFLPIFQFIKKLITSMPSLEKDAFAFVKEVYISNINIICPDTVEELSINNEYEVALEKIAVLVENVVPKEIKIIYNWNKILSIYAGKINNDIFINFLKCVNKHIIWKLEMFLENNTIQEELVLDDVNLERKRFLDVIFNAIKSTPSVDVKNELVYIFLEFSCDFHRVTFKKTDDMRIRAALDFNLFECEEYINNFIQYRIIEMRKNKLPLEKRQYLIGKFIEMAQFGKFSFNRLCSVFKYYLSHYKLFGELIDLYINTFPNQPLAFVIEKTIFTKFQKLSKLDESDSQKEEELKNLNDLITKFQSHEKVHSKVAVQILLYAFQDIKKDNLTNLLDIFSCFFKTLNEDDKKIIILAFNRHFANNQSEGAKHFKSMFPKEKRKSSPTFNKENKSKAKKARMELSTRTLNSVIEEVQDSELQFNKNTVIEKEITTVETKKEENLAFEENEMTSPVLVRKKIKE